MDKPTKVEIVRAVEEFRNDVIEAFEEKMDSHLMLDITIRNVTEELWEAYMQGVYAYAEEQFKKYVEPFCEEHNCEFIAGNGEWWLDNIPEVDEHHPLYDVLTEKIPGISSSDVGSLMPRFKKGD